MIEEKKNIVILMYQYSIVVKGIEKKLQDIGYNVTVHVGNVDKLAEYMKKTSLFIVYFPNDLMSKIIGDEIEIKYLAKTEEIIRHYECPMIIIGEQADRPKLIELLPYWNNYEWIDRPVKMNIFGIMVEHAILSSNKKGEKHILIVDDDPSYAKMVKEWLKDTYKVHVVTNGLQVLTFLEKNPIDLILLDYEMPEINGPQVLQILRQEPTTRLIPVIFLTGVDSKENVMKVMDMKPNGYILKSTTKEQLLDYLKEKI
ncbi:MAG: response regulator [Selenomonadaceae bacterium]|nr:response regulator [Selenomonadaceae bacterium]